MAGSAPITVVETPEFLSATRKLMDDGERSLLVAYLAHHPTAGDLVPAPAASESCDGHSKVVERVAVPA